MSLCKFSGGPLNGERRRMDVYTHLIPLPSYGYDSLMRPNAYYLNVSKTLVGKDMTNQLSTHYVFHIKGVMHASVDKAGNYVP